MDRASRSRLPALAGLVYTVAGLIAAPLAFISARMRQGWRQRLGLELPGPCEVWIQGASAGECNLVHSLIDRLPGPVLLTTCTRQGIEVLEKIRSKTPFFARMFPLDLPPLMNFVLAKVRPKVVVLLETEVWPGLLLACRNRNIPVVVINARMSTSSLAGYLRLRPLLRLVPPAAVGAIAPADAMRFDLVFGPGRTTVTGNIKFDRLSDMHLPLDAANPLGEVISPDSWFIVLGSVREEEEPLVLDMIRLVLEQNPRAVLGLFPRHMHRIRAWTDLLTGAGIPWARRSDLTKPADPGSVIVWDRFGELATAYALARRAFVGGSLKRLGGQNFLEPLARGTAAVVGPHTRNFSWVGDEIFRDLVVRNPDIHVLARTLTTPAPDRQEIRDKAMAYIRARQGASAASIPLVTRHLSGDTHE